MLSLIARLSIASAPMLLAACDPNLHLSGTSKPLPTENGPGPGGNDIGGAEQGGSGGSGGNSSGGGGSGGGQGACDGGGPELETAGAEDRFLLRGTLLLPAGPLEGELLIEGDTITCAAASCSAEPGATGATVFDTNGIISPGLIDTHNHIQYDFLDEDDWSPTQTYTNHNQWGSDPRYVATVDAKQCLNDEAPCPLTAAKQTLGCELLKYGETKALIAGTTSVFGSALTANKGCYGSIARTIDQSPNGLPDDKIQAATLFPQTSSADGVCTNFGDGDTTAYLIHIAEGVDQTARDEFDDLNTITTTDGCLLAPQTTIVHGAALLDAQLTTMAAEGMSLSWSPRSNIFLYGAGTDMTKTTDIPLALSKGITVALSPDWSLGGSVNLLDEMRYANQVDDAVFGDILDAQKLFEMVTVDAAQVLALEDTIGSLVVGQRADVSVFLPVVADPYEAILAAGPRDVTLVFVDGRLLYGDADLVSSVAADAVPETLDVCCREKFLAIGVTGRDPADKLEQTYAEFEGILQTAMVDFDELDISEWNFAPIAPLVKCP